MSNSWEAKIVNLTTLVCLDERKEGRNNGRMLWLLLLLSCFHFAFEGQEVSRFS
jgi:hypothetical protein